MIKLPEVERIFRINSKDLTFFKFEKDDGFNNGVRVMLYLRYENIWCYPPTDRMETIFWRNLNKFGFVYAEKALETEKQRLDDYRNSLIVEESQ